MAVVIHKIYFKEGLPKVRSIKDTFFKITGLKLGYYSRVFLEELIPSETDEIAYRTYLSERKLKLINHEKFKGDRKAAAKNLLWLEDPFFDCEGFNSIDLGQWVHEDIGKNHLSLVSHIHAIKNFYFLFALTKTMLELGGLKHSRYGEYDEVAEDYLEPYHPYGMEWKNIRKWDEMSDFEKSESKNRHYHEN